MKDIGIEIAFLVSGLFGAILMVSNDAAKNVKQTMLAIFGGMASANYLTPVIVELLKLENPKLENGIAFIIGFLGLRLVELVSNKLIRNVKKIK